MKNKIKLIATALSIIGIGASAFSYATDVFASSELNKMQTVPTSYQVPKASAPKKINVKDASKEKESNTSTPQQITVTRSDIAEGTAEFAIIVKEADVTGEAICSEEECNDVSFVIDEPTSVDLNIDEAAQTGMQYLAEVYDNVNFENANVYMTYNSGTVTFPRAFWSGDVLLSKTRNPDSTRWSFMIDAVTGELFNAGYYEKLSVKVPLGLDHSLEKNYDEYAKLAKEYYEKCSFLKGQVSDVLYDGQGYSGNNPEIMVDVVTEDGKTTNMSFSKYDKKLMGIITDNSLKITESAIESLSENIAVESSDFSSAEVSYSYKDSNSGQKYKSTVETNSKGETTFYTEQIAE